MHMPGQTYQVLSLSLSLPPSQGVQQAIIGSDRIFYKQVFLFLCFLAIAFKVAKCWIVSMQAVMTWYCGLMSHANRDHGNEENNMDKGASRFFNPWFTQNSPGPRQHGPKVDGKSKSGQTWFQVPSMSMLQESARVMFQLSTCCWKCLLSSTWSRTYNSIFPEISVATNLFWPVAISWNRTTKQQSSPHNFVEPSNGPTILTNPKWMLWYQETHSLDPTDIDPAKWRLEDNLFLFKWPSLRVYVTWGEGQTTNVTWKNRRKYIRTSINIDNKYRLVK